ncbi:hypothetical protein QZH41_004526 [Actinostola sp. cb2023]|nr:hypothetical protein QZH41_004526 [Actinostola sp. cb2023]
MSLSLGKFSKSPSPGGSGLPLNFPRLRGHLITNIPQCHGITYNNDVDNEIAIVIYDNQFHVYIADQKHQNDSAENFLDEKWHHVCLTWDNSFGKYYFYIDGVQKIGGAVAKDGQIRAPGAIVLGQDQDKYLGGFQEHQSFTGNLTSVNMWDKALDASGVADLAKRCSTGEGNLVKWSDLYDKRIVGAVQLACLSTCM